MKPKKISRQADATGSVCFIVVSTSDICLRTTCNEQNCKLDKAWYCQDEQYIEPSSPLPAGSGWFWLGLIGSGFVNVEHKPTEHITIQTSSADQQRNLTGKYMPFDEAGESHRESLPSALPSTPPCPRSCWSNAEPTRPHTHAQTRHGQKKGKQASAITARQVSARLSSSTSSRGERRGPTNTNTSQCSCKSIIAAYSRSLR
jgi:hypothetical protein